MKRILAEVRVPVPDEEDPGKVKIDDEGNTVYEVREVYVHHWGLQYESIEDKQGNISIGQYTVAICEDGVTGQVHTFMPTQLKIVGYPTYH